MTHRPLFQNGSSSICPVCVAAIHWLDDDDGDSGGNGGGDGGGGRGGSDDGDDNEVAVAAMMMIKIRTKTSTYRMLTTKCYSHKNTIRKVLLSPFYKHNREAQRWSISYLVSKQQNWILFLLDSNPCSLTPEYRVLTNIILTLVNFQKYPYFAIW